MYGSSDGSDSLCRTSSLSSHFLSPLHPCPAWSGPPYIWQRPFLYALPLSLFTHCAFQTQKSSLGSQSESDRPQKRAFTSSYTHLLWLHLLIFLVHFCFLLVQFRSWRSWRTCHARCCCALSIGSRFLGLLDVFLFWVFFFFALVAGGFGDYQHVELHGSL